MNISNIEVDLKTFTKSLRAALAQPMVVINGKVMSNVQVLSNERPLNQQEIVALIQHLESSGHPEKVVDCPNCKMFAGVQ